MLRRARVVVTRISHARPRTRTGRPSLPMFTGGRWIQPAGPGPNRESQRAQQDPDPVDLPRRAWAASGAARRLKAERNDAGNGPEVHPGLLNRRVRRV